MLIAPVVREFNDYRAYVSHDICKQRLLLAMWGLEGASRALQDDYAWGLFRDEVVRLFDLGPTLFGFVTQIFSDGRKRVNELVARVDRESPGVLKGQERSFVVVRESIEHLSALLSAMPDQMKDQRPGFSEENILKYLDGHDAMRCDIEYRKFVTIGVTPLAKRVFKKRGEGGSYAEFWKRCPEVDLLLRKLLVSLALEDRDPETHPVVQEGKIRMRAMRQAVASFSPSVEVTEREQALADALDAYGYSSVQDLMDAVEKLAES